MSSTRAVSAMSNPDIARGPLSIDAQKQAGAGEAQFTAALKHRLRGAR
jgi:hypothetical protein